jgi:UDP-N-acetylglucosamine--N-acetylmuramyl-(pentapeptide) pyrophosphoryl-undecaprenol N-acetylglucosamine transferase
LATQHGVAKSLTIVLTGGGTGGHITPILAVAQELKAQRPDTRIIYIGERGGKFSHLTSDHQAIDGTRTIFAGKFRRYHGESWLRRLLDIKTLVLNLRDGFLIMLGVLQGLVLVRRLKPDVIFLKGGFVGVPVGLAAALWRIPFITHDSDALPGLANRLVARWAKWHATGMPADYYPYPQAKIRYVGVLVSNDYLPVSATLQAAYKKELGIPPEHRLLLVTGGSLGARRLNTAMTGLAPTLLEKHHDLHIVHQVGKGNDKTYGPYQHERLQVLEFMEGMHRYTGAADVVVTRAGANTLAELGVQGKACIVVPNPLLTGGHQLKNAAYLTEQAAAMVIEESTLTPSADTLRAAIESLLTDAAQAQAFAHKLQSITVKNAAQQLAELLLTTASG